MTAEKRPITKTPQLKGQCHEINTAFCHMSGALGTVFTFPNLH